jgi:hypothetical protein
MGTAQQMLVKRRGKKLTGGVGPPAGTSPVAPLKPDHPALKTPSPYC